MNYVKAIRMTNLGLTFVPVLIATTVCGPSYYVHENFARILLSCVGVQCGAQLVNTYFDYRKGVDSKKSIQNTTLTGADVTLMEKKVHASHLLLMAALFYCAAAGVLYLPIGALPEKERDELVSTVILAMVLSFFYSAEPVGLKYKGLGDITVFMCFGPLLMQAVSIVLTGKSEEDNMMTLYSLPIGAVTVAIFHANNLRDINDDTTAGITTFASLIGFDYSYLWYTALLVISYTLCLLMSIVLHWGLLLVLLTMPSCTDLIERYQRGLLKDLDLKTSRLHMFFGLVFAAGIAISHDENMFQLLARKNVPELLVEHMGPLIEFINKKVEEYGLL